MSLLLRHSLTEAIEILRGTLTPSNQAERFSVEGMRVWHLPGLREGFTGSPSDPDAGLESVVRGWWGRGITWGVMAAGTATGIDWNFILPNGGNAQDTLSAALPGVELHEGADFASRMGDLKILPHRLAVAGHPGTEDPARLDALLRALSGHPFIWLVLAQPVEATDLKRELAWLHEDERFIQDEHLSRPGLEHDNHPAARHCADLLEAARERLIAAQQEGGWQVRSLLAAATEDDLRTGTTLLQAAFGSGGGKPEPLRWQPVEAPRGLTFLRSAEASALVRLPREELPGFTIETVSRDSDGKKIGNPFSTAPAGDFSVPTICLGRIMRSSSGSDQWLEIPRDDLCRHVLIAGMTGSGKTTTCEHILLELWREHHIPWLVIEPGLNPSYRRLLHSEIGPDLRVYSPGSSQGVPLPLNPLAAPAGVGLAEHIGGLYSTMIAAFDLVPPMPEVLSTAIEQTYRRHGWDPNGIVPDTCPPSYEMLLSEIERTTKSLGYAGHIADNIRAGLVLRLRSLATGPIGPELTSEERLDTAVLTAFPTVVELAALPNADTQAFVMGLLTLQLRHHWRLAGRCATLRHVTVIEEAHRLLRKIPASGESTSRARAVEDMANLLAELRGMGAGLIISDQTPSELTPATIANTGVKILHRLDHPDDRKLAGQAVNLTEDFFDALGALPTGEALVRVNQRAKPYRLIFPNPALSFGNKPLPDNAMIRSQMEKLGLIFACPVCGDSACAVRRRGADRIQLPARLKQLQNASQLGSDAVWAWATAETRSVTTGASSVTPLCYLLSLGKEARLPEATLAKLREQFEKRTRK